MMMIATITNYSFLTLFKFQKYLISLSSCHSLTKRRTGKYGSFTSLQLLVSCWFEGKANVVVDSTRDRKEWEQ
jgi:hypothetical protein